MNSKLMICATYVAFLMACMATRVAAQTFDISSGGQPTISGALSGSVSGSSSVLNNLSVTVNFGEISPANSNSLVKVVVPIAVRSTQPYQISVTVSGFGNANPQALQSSDIGFGANNMRSLGSGAQSCTKSSHIFYAPFGNDPAVTKTIAANGRATYQSTLSNVSGSTVILSGPRLTKGSIGARETNDGYAFDTIFALTPQFFAAGGSSATITFTISAGPSVPC
jgi:hypothetical protein